MAENKDIKYFNRDFAGLRNLLVDFSKTYFPNTYNDFSPSSPGMMFMEMSAYVGDVLSFYLDNQIQETFLQYAKQSTSLYTLAYMLGYRPKVTKAATVDIDFYQQVPSKLSGSVYIPDLDYALLFAQNTQLKSSTGDNYFLVQDPIDFSSSSSFDPTETTVYQISAGAPQYFLLKKSRKGISGQIQTTTYNFGAPEAFTTVTLQNADIIQILDITDSDGNVWYEVPYLGQEMVYVPIRNTNTNDPNYYSDSDAPYLMQLEKIQRRFTTRFTSENTLEIQFGSGTTNDVDEVITPNPNNVGLGLPYEQSKLTTAFDPTNFLYTDTYGIAPANTTLTVRYLAGGGIASNVEASTLTSFVNTTNINFINSNLNTTTANYIFSTLAVNNPRAASGGGDGDTLEEIRQNTLVAYQSQLRNVTPNDYLIRALSMPSNYGSVAKAFVQPVKASETTLPGQIPTTLNLYVLGYNANGYLTQVSDTVKQNLSTYLSEYRIAGDTVTIKDGYVINIGCDFEIVVRPNFISSEVLLSCLSELKSFFKTENWQFNQPIILKDLFILLDKVSGVQTVKSVTISNKTGISQGYSEFAYDTTIATQGNVIYPSIDPMIFEVKYPDTDIKGRVVSL
jgi:hypothetical protein